MTNRMILSRLLCLMSVGACSGTIDSSDPGSAGPDDSPPAAGPGAPGGPTHIKPPTIPSPDTGLRRLTRAEYANTLRDLLGDRSQATGALDRDRTLERSGLDNNAELLNQASPPIDQYNAVAAEVVGTALRPGTASRAKLLTCDPAVAGATCARSVVSAFARRAWRRPVEPAELDELMTAALESQGDGMEEVLRLALRMVLVSPNFLYRVEVDPANSQGLHRLDPYALATRLSYFVWSSMPDDHLSKLADDGTLGDPKVFASELARMLSDSKADALVDNFAAQWLESIVTASGQTVRVAEVTPDTMKFKDWSDALRAAMAAETQQVFRSFLKGDHADGNVADLLFGDFTYANDKLAIFYGLGPVKGSQMQQVSVDGKERFGLLSHAGILTLTSNKDRTVPTRRGKWVLSRLLCSPPPEPPADVPPLEAVKLPANATLRQRLAVHKDKGPACAGCHVVMDAIGLGLEHYNGIGMWIDTYPRGVAIDATGELPGGAKFDGGKELAELLKNDPRFPACFARTLLAHALGREPTAEGDVALVDWMAAELAARGGRMRELVTLVASSDAFQLRGGGRP